MTKDEFMNLKKGDLVIYTGGAQNTVESKEKHKCTGLILEVDDPHVTYEVHYGKIKEGVRLVQPFIKSDFEMYISKWNLLQFYKAL